MRASPVRTHAASVDPEAPFSVRLEGARDGKAWALAALYRTLQPKLLRYLAVRDAEGADEVAAHVWRDVSVGLKTFDGGEAEFTAWTFALARRQLVQRRALGDCDVGDGRVLRRFEERTQAALRCLGGLPEDEADVFLLRVVAGLSADEVASIVGKPRSMVRALQQRALERLVRSRGRARELVA